MKMFLKNLETYWAGVRYITAALTQKADGVGSARLDIAQEGPNVTLISALNSKAKAARPLVPNDPNCRRNHFKKHNSSQAELPRFQGSGLALPVHSIPRRIKQSRFFVRRIMPVQ
jgi:hypothetical protein